MVKPASTATSGDGSLIATFTDNSKEHQSYVWVDWTGHIVGSKDYWTYAVPNQVLVAAASTAHVDIFNADATVLVRVLSIKIKPDILTAVTGVTVNWDLIRTSAVGTGGVAQTAWGSDLSQAALSASITCRSKPTGGATSGTTLGNYQISSEETNAATQMLRMMMDGDVADLVPADLRRNGQGILLRQNQGLKIVQQTNTAAGNCAFQIGFTVE